jgi:hypothetical protein
MKKLELTEAEQGKAIRQAESLTVLLRSVKTRWTWRNGGWETTLNLKLNKAMLSLQKEMDGWIFKPLKEKE